MNISSGCVTLTKPFTNAVITAAILSSINLLSFLSVKMCDSGNYFEITWKKQTITILSIAYLIFINIRKRYGVIHCLCMRFSLLILFCVCVFPSIFYYRRRISIVTKNCHEKYDCHSIFQSKFVGSHKNQQHHCFWARSQL